MTVLEDTQRKIERFIDRIRALRAGDFAQVDAKQALEDIQQLFERRRLELLSLAQTGGDPALIANHCRLVLGSLFRYLPLLGFLHRSKNASNPFEFYGPLQDLAKQVIAADARVILSSEWGFSPSTLVRLPDFANYVLVGMPASEARNALLIPLAGHEFGHSVWARQRVLDKIKGPVRDNLVVAIRARITEWTKHFPAFADESKLPGDATYVRAYYPAYVSALKQCEEVFCDCIGLLLFETSYLHAFAYLLAPGIPGQRTPTYPTLRDRAEYLVEFAKGAGVAVPTGYEELFIPQPAQVTTADELLISLGDEVMRSMLDDVRTKAIDHISSVAVGRIDEADVRTIVREFKLLAPAMAPTSLRSIVAAAWEAEANPSMWQDFPQVNSRRHEVLNELVIKSAQVLEYINRTSNS